MRAEIASRDTLQTSLRILCMCVWGGGGGGVYYSKGKREEMVATNACNMYGVYARIQTHM